jgi:RNA polymerase sigma factor (TIGR02999 family)
MSGTAAITDLLEEFAGGNKTALDRLMPLVYSELRKLADGYLRRERPGHTLQPTALVHEAYVRLIDQPRPDIRNRAHFLGVAAHVMRQILIDHARSRNAAKRGGGQVNISLHEVSLTPVERPSIIIAIDDALHTLEKRDGRKARLIEMRFFGGLTAEESSEVLQMPVDKVRTELRFAQAWLQRELTGKAAGAK